MSKILALGNPLLDISSNVDQAFLDKYNMKAGAAGLCTEEQVGIFQELDAREDVVYVPGGSALNSIRVANWQLQTAGLPGRVTYIGGIGKDKFADILAEKCTTEGVHFACHAITDKPTGTCAVGILGKERALLANVAAAGAFPLEGLTSPAALKGIINSDIMYTTGFFLLTNSTAAINTATAYKALGRTVIMNLSADFIVHVCADALKAMYPLCDYIICNENEAEAWRAANADGLAKDVPAHDLSAIATALANLNDGKVENTANPRTAIVTHGALPTVTVRAGDVPVEHPVPFVDPDTIVDLNSAGDAFVGGFLAGFAQGKPLVDNVLLGNQSGPFPIYRRLRCDYIEYFFF